MNRLLPMNTILLLFITILYYCLLLIFIIVYYFSLTVYYYSLLLFKPITEVQWSGSPTGFSDLPNTWQTTLHLEKLFDISITSYWSCVCTTTYTQISDLEHFRSEFIGFRVMLMLTDEMNRIQGYSPLANRRKGGRDTFYWFLEINWPPDVICTPCLLICGANFYLISKQYRPPDVTFILPLPCLINCETILTPAYLTPPVYLALESIGSKLHRTTPKQKLLLRRLCKK